MRRYLLGRALSSALVVVGVSAVVFALTFLSGDPATLMLPADATQGQIADFRRQMGFSDPIPVQYARFLGRAVRGDFGTSLKHGQPALPLILEHLPPTLELSVSATLLAVLVAVPLGVFAATHRGRPGDLLSMGLGLVGQSMPNFWLAIMMIYLFAVSLHWLPTSGRGGLSHLVLPALAIALNFTAIFLRLVRSSMLEVLGEDYVRTARAKGLAGSRVLVRHALRNAVVPLITVVGLQFGYILGGAVVIETVFTWPGVGLFTVQAIMNRDYPLVQASVFVLATGVVLINLVVDGLYGLCDPRIRLAGGA